MSIKIFCPHCERPYTLPDTQKGKTIRCKECKETFVVGKPRRSHRDEDDDEQERAPQKKAKKGGMPMWLWLAGGGGLLVAATVVIVIVVTKGSGGGGSPSADNFKKIVPGMPEDQVLALLGPPSRSGTPDQILGPKRMKGKGYDEAKIMVWVDGKSTLTVSIIAAKVNHAGISTDTAAPVDDTSPQSPLAQKVAKLQTGLREAEVVAILGPPTRTADKDPLFPILNMGAGQFGPPKILIWEMGADKITMHIASDAVVNGGSLVTSVAANAPATNPAFTAANFEKLKDAKGSLREYEVRKIFGPPTKAIRTKFLKIGEYRTELTWQADGVLNVRWVDGRFAHADAEFAGKKYEINIPGFAEK